MINYPGNSSIPRKKSDAIRKGMLIAPAKTSRGIYSPTQNLESFKALIMVLSVGPSSGSSKTGWAIFGQYWST